MRGDHMVRRNGYTLVYWEDTGAGGMAACGDIDQWDRCDLMVNSQTVMAFANTQTAIYTMNKLMGALDQVFLKGQDEFRRKVNVLFGTALI